MRVERVRSILPIRKSNALDIPADGRHVFLRRHAFANGSKFFLRRHVVFNTPNPSLYSA